MTYSFKSNKNDNNIIVYHSKVRKFLWDIQRHHMYIQVISLQLRVSFPFSDSSWNSTVVARENMVDSLESVRILQPPKRTRSHHRLILETTSVSTFVFIDIRTSGRKDCSFPGRGGTHQPAEIQYLPKCLPLESCEHGWNSNNNYCLLCCCF